MGKIAACLIVKDDTEEKSLNRCLSTVAPHVDGIFITGTKKPQKKIQKLCKKYGATWSWFEWIKDFSAARNFNFSQVPKDYDWIFWCDADDILANGKNLREAAALGEANDLKAIFARYLYQVEIGEDGTIKEILIEHLRERLIKNDGTFEWIAPIHETLIEKVPAGKTDYQGFYVVHLTSVDDMFASMWRNIEILEEEVVRNPQDPRPLYYLAKAYFDTKEPKIVYEPAGEGIDSITIELLKDYLRKSGWQEERGQAWEYLAWIHRERGEYKKAIQALLESMYEWPQPPSVYIQLALCYVLLKDWVKAQHWIKMAGATEIPKTTLVTNPRDYKAMILEALFHIYMNTGKLEECQKVAQELVRLVPSDLSNTRLAEISDLKHKNDLAHWIVKLANHLYQTRQMDQLRALINGIPSEIAFEPVLQNLRNQFIPPHTWGDDEITVFAVTNIHEWSPKSVAKGIGGSEEAIIYLTKELAKQGWKVTVYCEPGSDEGEYDGVKYIHHSKMNWNDQFNIFVAWRAIGIFDRPLKAKKTYLWNHDIQNALTYTPERVEKIDKVMFLSKWHKDMMGPVPTLPDDKVMFTGNGITV